MKIRLLSLLILVPMLFCCTDPIDENNDNQNGQEQKDPDTGTNTQNEDEDLAPEVKDGDVILVTNANMEKFLTEVTYPENDYTDTHILDAAYAPTAPGNSDRPQEYTIRWAKDTDSPAVRLWEDDGWSRDYTDLSSSDYFITITNLRPNANYHFEVTSGGKAVKSGSFKTTGHVHQVFFYKQVRNARDLGGWKTKDGSKTVKYRKVYRGGRLQANTLTAKGIKDIQAEGIKAQLDLRGTSDVLSAPAIQGMDFCAPVIEEGYSHLLKNDQAKAKECFEFIAKCVHENKPVYFHCSLGRDRTGTIGMMVLGILGVNEGDISKEYELTQFAPHGWATSDGEKTKMTRKADYDDAAKYIWSLAGEGGSFADGMQNYLLSIGVAQATIDQFRSEMLE